MGRVKNTWMEQLEDELWEERCEWIREQLEDDEADENTDGWEELSEEFDILKENENYDDYLYMDEWSVEGKSRFDIFDETIASARKIIDVELPLPFYKNLSVMVYAHIVAAIESYLSSTFIEIALSTDDHMRKLVENDPEFAKRKFTIKDIFIKREELKNDLRQYLKELIFHDIAKVKPMYLSVLDIDFGNVEWLFKAVTLRHHCVHRAGYDKEGNEVGISKETIAELINKAATMIGDVEAAIITIPRDGSFFLENITKA